MLRGRANSVYKMNVPPVKCIERVVGSRRIGLMYCHGLGKDGHLLVHRGWSLTGLLKMCFDDHHGLRANERNKKKARGRRGVLGAHYLRT